MNLFERKNMKKIITALALLGLVGCGGGSNNDQGTTFTLTGYTASCASDATGVAGFTVPLGTDPEVEGASGGISAGLQLANILEKQFIRTEHAFFTYYIPGASLQPPATTAVAGGLIPAAGVAGASTGCIETFVVPAEVRQWLVLNRNFLPELPFTMQVAGFVTGISQAGDRFDTNELLLGVQFTVDIIIPPVEEGGEDEGDAAAGDSVETDTDGTDESLDGTDGATGLEGLEIEAEGTGTEGESQL